MPDPTFAVVRCPARRKGLRWCVLLISITAPGGQLGHGRRSRAIALDSLWPFIACLLLGKFDDHAHAGIATALGAIPARAELSCQEFERAYILDDGDVLARATVTMQPWAEARAAAFTLQDSENLSAGDVAKFFLDQLANECLALPSDTVDSIVATHLKTAKRHLAALAGKKATEQAAAKLAVPQPLNRSNLSPSLPNPPNDTAALSADQRGAIVDHVRECWDQGCRRLGH
jgi:hypothetical protein